MESFWLSLLGEPCSEKRLSRQPDPSTPSSAYPIRLPSSAFPGSRTTRGGYSPMVRQPALGSCLRGNLCRNGFLHGRTDVLKDWLVPQAPPACCNASHMLLYYIEDCLLQGSFGRTINPFFTSHTSYFNTMSCVFTFIVNKDCSLLQ